MTKQLAARSALNLFFSLLVSVTATPAFAADPCQNYYINLKAYLETANTGQTIGDIYLVDPADPLRNSGETWYIDFYLDGKFHFTTYCYTGYKYFYVPPEFPPLNNPRCEKGSIIHVDSLAVGERVPIVGTEFDLVYFSDRAPGRTAEYNVTFPLPEIDPGQALDLKVTVGDQSHTVPVDSQSGSQFDFLWNGKNAAGELDPGSQNVGYTYWDSELGVWISHFAATPVGHWQTKTVGVGAWTLSSHHFYDRTAERIYHGSGGSKQAAFRSLSNGTLLVVSDRGDEAYIFDAKGNHLFTKTSLLGSVIYSFHYDSLGRFESVTDAFANKTKILRDASGQLFGVESPYGQVTKVTTDTNGYIASIQTPSGDTYSMTYWGTGGLLKTFTKPMGQVSSFNYDPEGRLLSDLNSAGPGKRFDSVLSSALRLITMTTAEERQTKFTTTFQDSIVGQHTIDPIGVERHVVTDRANGLFQEQSSDTTTTVNSADDVRFGNLLRTPYRFQTAISGSNLFHSVEQTQTVELNDPSDLFSVAHLRTQALVNGNFTFVTEFDGTSKKITSTSAMGRKSVSSLDEFERVISTQEANFVPVDFSYESRGRIKTITQGARRTSITYNSEGFVESVENPLGQVTSLKYDLTGLILEKTLPDGRVIGFSYDQNGNLTSLTPPSRPAYAFGINLMELVTTFTPPLLGGTSAATLYSYNLDRELTRITRPDQQIIDLSYDRSYLQSIATSLGQNTFSYNTNGLLKTATSIDQLTLDYSYIGRLPMTVQLSKSGTTVGTLAIDYDNEFRAKSMTINSEPAIDLVYDSDGLLQYLGPQVIHRDLATGLILGTEINGLKEEMSYSDFPELKSHQASFNGNTLYSATFTRDDLGRIKTKTETINGVTSAFTYSYYPNGRLSDVTQNSTNRHYDYDGNGNRLSTQVSGASPVPATYDVHDQILTSGDKTYSHNLNGELISKIVGSVTPPSRICSVVPVLENIVVRIPFLRRIIERIIQIITSQNRCTTTPGTSAVVTHYTFDALGNLKSVQLPGKKVDYLVDAHHRRTARVVDGVVQSYYLYQSETQIAAEITPSGDLKTQFVYGTKVNVPDLMISGGKTYKIFSDYLGSVRLVIDPQSGAIAQALDYDEFGNTLRDTSPGFQPFGFAGGLADTDTKLVRFGARDYDSETGRWLSKDPILFSGGDTNLYGYTWNDPINFIDPDGESAGAIGIGVGVGIGAGIGSVVIPIPGLGAVIGGAIGGIIGGWPSSTAGPELDTLPSPGAAEMGSGNSNSCPTTGGHRKNQRPSNREKHEEAERRRRIDQGGEKGDKNRDYPRQRPPGYKGPWPPGN